MKPAMQDTDYFMSELLGDVYTPQQSKHFLFSDEYSGFNGVELDNHELFPVEFQPLSIPDFTEIFTQFVDDELPEVTTSPEQSLGESGLDGGCSGYDTGSDYVDSNAMASPAMSSADSVGNSSEGDVAYPTEKKKRQNREAAKRYRMKKKSVSRVVAEEEKQLEIVNFELRQNIDRLEAKLAVIKDVLCHQYGFPTDSDIMLVQVS